MTRDAETGDRRRNRLVESLPIVLATAVVTGLGVALYYEVWAGPRRDPSGIETIKLLTYTRAMRAGEKITECDLRAAPVRQDVAQQLGAVVRSKSRTYLIGRKLRSDVNPDQWVQWSHVQSGNQASPIVYLNPGHVGVMIDVENAVPACRPGARVNVLAKLSKAAISPPRVFRLIRNVLVIGVVREGGHSTVSLAVKVAEARKLVRLLQWADSGCMLEVLPDGAASRGDKDGVVNPDGDEVLNGLLPPPPSP